ncbi:Hypothetical Protein FCC1311_097682, partial [Hondaea fermentalgiana]
ILNGPVDVDGAVAQVTFEQVQEATHAAVESLESWETRHDTSAAHRHTEAAIDALDESTKRLGIQSTYFMTLRHPERTHELAKELETVQQAFKAELNALTSVDPMADAPLKDVQRALASIISFYTRSVTNEISRLQTCVNELTTLLSLHVPGLTAPSTSRVRMSKVRSSTPRLVSLLTLDAAIRSGEVRDLSSVLAHETQSVHVRRMAMEAVVVRRFIDEFGFCEGRDLLNGPEKSHADLAIVLADGHYVRVQLKYTRAVRLVQSPNTSRYPGCLMLYALVDSLSVKFSVGIAGESMDKAKRVWSRSMLDREVMRLVLAKQVEVVTDVTDCFQVKTRRDYVGHLGEVCAKRFLQMAGLRVESPFVNQLPYDLVVNGDITVQVKTSTFRPASPHSTAMQTKQYAAEVRPHIFIFCLLVNDQPRSLYVLPGELVGESFGVHLPLAGVPSHLLATKGRFLIEVHDADAFDANHLRALVLGLPLPEHVETRVKLLRVPSLGPRACEWPRWWSLARRAACKVIVENLQAWGCECLWSGTEDLEIVLSDGETRVVGVAVRNGPTCSNRAAFIEVDWDYSTRRPRAAALVLDDGSSSVALPFK